MQFNEFNGSSGKVILRSSLGGCGALLRPDGAARRAAERAKWAVTSAKRCLILLNMRP